MVNVNDLIHGCLQVTNLIRLTRRLPVPLEEKYIRVEEEEEEDDDVIIEEPQRDDWPELSDEQEEMVDRAFNCRNPSQVLAEGFRLQITARDIATLQGTNWLNDEVRTDLYQVGAEVNSGLCSCERL